MTKSHVFLKEALCVAFLRKANINKNVARFIRH